MTVYVVLTAVLIQKGSPESRSPEEGPKERSACSPNAAWPVRKGGIWLQLYAHSLSITLLVLFGLSFWLHLLGSTRHANEEALLHAAPAETAVERLADPEFWYESFQNWQSEFLSIGALVVLGSSCASAARPSSSRFTPPMPRQAANGSFVRENASIADISSREGLMALDVLPGDVVERS